MNTPGSFNQLSLLSYVTLMRLSSMNCRGSMGAKGCRGLSGRTRATSKSGDGKPTFSGRGRTLCLRKLYN